MKKHLHHDAIVAWAGGAQIQLRRQDGQWIDCFHVPEWNVDIEYRAKPPDTKYPTSKMDVCQMRLAMASVPPISDISAGWRAIADAALRHACDAGQVVPREEFDRALADREARDAAVADTALKVAHETIISMGMGVSKDVMNALSYAAATVRETAIAAIICRVNL